MPCTLIGLVIGVLPSKGTRKFVVRRGTLGIYGQGLEWLLLRAPIDGGALAMTFGHVILARDQHAFESTFEHEWIHVKQYVWWGPLFFPAYGASSVRQWMRGRNPYLDNSFEVHARKYEQK